MITEGQRHAHEVRQRLMNGKPPSFRSKIVEIRRRLDEIAKRPESIPPPKIFSVMRMPTNRQLAAMPRWRQVAFQVALKHNLTVTDLLSSSRKACIVKARHEAMWRLSKETNLTTTQIGRLFKRDHSTCIVSVRKHQWRMDQEAMK